MKKAKIILSLIVVFVLCTVLGACNINPPTYTLNKTEASLEVGQTQQLSVTASDGSAVTVVYSTDKANVATVSEGGLVTAIAAGKANITAKVGEITLTCVVTVTDPTPPPVDYTYAISKSSETLEVGESETLSVTVTPQKDITVAWSSSNDAVATVANGVVTAVSAGTAKITATVDGETLTCDITVVKPAPLFTLAPSGTQELEAGKTLQLNVTSSDEDPFEVVWSSSNDAVATVDANGLVTAVDKGEAIIKAKIGEVEKTCTIKVFKYEYSFPAEIALNYGQEGKIEVSIAPDRDMELAFAVKEGTSATVDAEGTITTAGVGTTIITIKDGDIEVGQVEVKVSAVFAVAESVKLHAGATHQLVVDCKPADLEPVITYASSDETVATVSESGLITAVANGTATITLTVDGATLTTEVVVANTVASSAIEMLPEGNRDNPIDLTAGAEYWEQYINTETNHKAYVTAEEDIITMTSSVPVGYLGDYKSFISWTGGANKSTCDCGLCDKADINGGDGGWTDGGTKAMAVNVVDAIISVEIKLHAGQSTINIYTGGYNLKGQVQLKLGEEVIAQEAFDNQSAHHSQVVTFEVSTVEACTVVAELSMVDNYGDDGHSCISLAGVSVSGDVYQLAEKGVRLVPGQEKAIVLNKNGEALAEGVKYELVEGEGIVSLENGVAKALAVGSAKIAVSADGRTRFFVVEVGYVYNVEKEVSLHIGEKHQLTVVSEPAGSTAKATFTSSDAAVATVTEDGQIEAIANGSAIITVAIDGKEIAVEVIISDIIASAEVSTLPEGNRDNPIDLTAGAEYWEQYIGAEENHKLYASKEEDIITKTASNLEYLPDYKSFISWNGGANGSTCDCGLCNKENQNGGDGGWTNGGTKSAYLKVVDQVIALEFKVFAGDREIKIYTGGYNLLGKVQLKLDGEVIAEATFDNQSKHVSRLVTFKVSANKDCILVAELSMTNNFGDGNNSGISLAGASISGDVYQLAETNVRLVPGGEHEVVLNKNGEALAEGVTLKVVEGEDVVAIEGGKVKALKEGVAKVQAVVDGRVRTLIVNVGYDYSIDSEHVTLKQGKTHQIVVSSNPAGSTAKVEYASSDDSVATVDENGLIEAVGAGSATITVTVAGKVFNVEVVVSAIEVAVANRNINGEIIDLTAENVIYWEHYIWSETNPKAIENDAEDIIAIDISANGGDPGYGAHMYFTGSRGPKADSWNDGAYHKFSKGSLFTATVTVPAGTHEIRIYTGAWENTQNKVSLLNGEEELASHTIEKTPGGISMLVTFTVTTEEATPLTVKLEALEGDNCRLAAIAVATPDQASQSIITDKAQEELDGTKINLSQVGTIDWTVYNIEVNGSIGNVVSKVDANYIAEGAPSDRNEWDFRGSITWGIDGSVAADTTHDGNSGSIGAGYNNNFVAGDDRVEVGTKLDANVKSIVLYLTGWQSNYGVYVKDAQGKLVYASSVMTAKDGGSHAFAVTLAVNVAEEGNYTIGVCRIGSSGNVGIAAIALVGEPHEHATEGEYEHDENGHWVVCGCGEKVLAGEHDFTQGNCVCGVEPPHEHVTEGTYEYDEYNHWVVCGCGEKVLVGKHNFEEGDCICGAKAPEVPHEHVTEGEYVFDENGHWVVCTCGENVLVGEHDFSEGDCICGAEAPVEEVIYVEVSNRNIAGEIIDLTAENVIYWEQYIGGETNPKAVDNAEEDLIDVSVVGNSYDPGYGAHIYFEGSSGPKSDSWNDSAYHKFSWSSLISGTVKVPAGTHEIRIYTGAWENTINKVSLLNGEEELASHTIEKTPGGISMLVTFTVTTEEATPLTVKLEALEGDNCRLAAIAVATPDQASQSIVTGKEQVELDGTKINLSQVGTIDWTAYNIEANGSVGNVVSKADSNYIADGAPSSQNEWDFRGSITWGLDGSIAVDSTHDGNSGSIGAGYNNNFVAGNDRVEFGTKLDANVKSIVLYLTGWQSNYGVYVKDAQGKLVYASNIFNARDGGSHAFAVTLAVNVAEEGNYTIGVCRVGSNGNVGIAAIALVGEPHEHATEGEYEHDENGHWVVCLCGEKVLAGEHDFSEGACICGAEPPHEHVTEGTYEYDEYNHWVVCGCGEKVLVGKHNFEEGDCICGAKAPEVPHEHVTEGEYVFDENGHWVVCTCGENVLVGEHDFSEGACICGAVEKAIEVELSNRNIAGEMIDLAAENVIYWEHYIWSETNPKAIENDAEDIIAIDISANGGDPGYGAHMYFTGSRGPKADSWNDGAYHKFSKGSLFTATVTVPAGTHEIRIYTGAWENTQNKVSLLNGEEELASHTIEKTPGGISMLVTFTVTTEEATPLTVKLEALEGDNCRLAAIAVATPDQASQSIVTGKEQVELDGDDINLSAIGTIDWVKYNVEQPGITNLVVGKNDGALISREDIGSGNGWDYKAKFTWGEDGNLAAGDCDDGDFDPGIHNNFRFDSERIEASVKLNADVKTITLYVSGWNSDYGLYIVNSEGRLEYVSSIFTARDGGSHAFAVTLTVDIEEAGDYKLCLRKIAGDGNMGFAAIALGGAAE